MIINTLRIKGAMYHNSRVTFVFLTKVFDLYATVYSKIKNYRYGYCHSSFYRYRPSGKSLGTQPSQSGSVNSSIVVHINSIKSDNT